MNSPADAGWHDKQQVIPGVLGGRFAPSSIQIWMAFAAATAAGSAAAAFAAAFAARAAAGRELSAGFHAAVCQQGGFF